MARGKLHLRLPANPQDRIPILSVPLDRIGILSYDWVFAMRHRVGFLLSLILALACQTAAAQDAGVDFFEKKVRPVLVEHCYRCHSHETKRPNPRGGLYLDSKAGLLEGGATGPAIVPGTPGESLLIKAVRHTAGELKMPKDGKLAPEIVADLEKW